MRSLPYTQTSSSRRLPVDLTETQGCGVSPKQGRFRAILAFIIQSQGLGLQSVSCKQGTSEVHGERVNELSLGQHCEAKRVGTSPMFCMICGSMFEGAYVQVPGKPRTLTNQVKTKCRMVGRTMQHRGFVGGPSGPLERLGCLRKQKEQTYSLGPIQFIPRAIRHSVCLG